MRTRSNIVASLLTLLAFIAPALAVAGTTITYQGRLLEGGQPAAGPVDLAFQIPPGRLTIKELIMSCQSSVHTAALAGTLMLIGPQAATATDGGNQVSNASFEVEGLDGPETTFTGRFGGGHSAALHWGVFNNTKGTTCTALLPTTLEGGGERMIHISTDGARNGISQAYLPFGEGPVCVHSSAWIFVVRGRIKGCRASAAMLAHHKTAPLNDLGVCAGQLFFPVEALIGHDAHVLLRKVVLHQPAIRRPVEKPVPHLLKAVGRFCGVKIPHATSPILHRHRPAGVLAE